MVPLQVGSLSRSYLLMRVIPQPGVKLPVLVVLAGRGMTPTVMARRSGFPAVTGPAIIVYPAGYGYSWNAGACCGVAQQAGVDDVAFLNAVVHQVLASQPDAAANQVYVIGYSNGGRMAYRLACADPGTFAGMAAVEAVPVSACSQLAPLPVDIVASSGDPLLSIDPTTPPKVIRGYVEPRVSDVVGKWRALDGCNGMPTVSVTGRAMSQTWDRCRGAGRLQYTLYAGGSHVWPMGGRSTPAAERLVWTFLRPQATPR